MPNIRTLYRAFVGGEMSPEFQGRVDDPRYQAGAARVRNMVPMPHGPVRRRPGFERVNAAFKTSSGTNNGARMLSFRFNDDQAYAIEVGYESLRTGYMRFYQDGEPITFTDDDAPDFLATKPYIYLAPDGNYQVIPYDFSTTDADISTVNDTWTEAGHGYVTGDEIGVFKLSGTMPTATPAIDTATKYYAIRVDADTFKIATSLANAQAGTAVNITALNTATLYWAKWNHLSDGNRFQVDGTAPSGLSTGKDYYVYRNAGLSFYVHTHRINASAYIAQHPSTASSTVATGNFRRYYQPGELIQSGGTYYTAKTNVLTQSNFAATVSTNWMQQDTDLIYTIWSPYAVSHLFEINRAQSNDILTLVHPEYAPRELRRYDTFFWSLPTVNVNAPLEAPENVAATRTLGARQALSYADTNGASKTWKFRNESGKPHNFVSGQSVYVWNGISTLTGVRMHVNTITATPSEFLLRYAETLSNFTYPTFSTSVVAGGTGTPIEDPVLLSWVNHPLQTGDRIDIAVNNGLIDTMLSVLHGTSLWVIRIDDDTFSLAESYALATASSPTAIDFTADYPGTRGVSYFRFYYSGSRTMGVQPVYDVANSESSYKVTALDSLYSESVASTAVDLVNNLAAVGAFNTLTWDSVENAIEYNVYKDQGGIYGYIGKSETTTFVDDFIAQDLGKTPPLWEAEFASADQYPSSVAYFEQRRAFAGTNDEPQTLWLSRSGTESDMSYHIPTQADDRIKVQLASREANVIRHIVPLNSLLLLTAGSEWAVRSIDNEALSPENIAVRPQSYIGSSKVQPVVVNNNALFIAARGNHLRELGYNDTANGYITGDLSLRAAHLVDGLTVKDLSYGKAPYPLVYATSSDGKLLCLTYIPEEQIAAWSWWDTDGDIESACVVPEGLEDRVYVVVNNGGTRSIQRLGTYAVDSLADSAFVDDHTVFDGTITDGRTITLTGGSNWGYGEVLTLTASSATFVAGDVGDQVVVYDADDAEYRIEITAYTSSTVVSGRAKSVIPASLRAVAVSSWAIARSEFTGLSHLNGRSCAILADGVAQDAQEVSGATLSLDSPAVKVSVGVPYTSEIWTLPVAAQVEALAQGRSKNVNKAWLRVYDSGTFEVGPLGGDLTEADVEADLASTATGEVRVTLMPSWTDGGQVHIRQTEPLPLTVVGMTLELAIGG